MAAAVTGLGKALLAWAHSVVGDSIIICEAALFNPGQSPSSVLTEPSVGIKAAH
jgi:hypothetical protein